MFVKYQHVERMGTTSTEGIENGDTYVFPKLDGTNSSIWLENGEIQCGSRKRHLSIEDDNAGFCKHISEYDIYKELLNNHPDLRIFGEWLVPHTIKDYVDSAWRKFYVFDVINEKEERYLTYDEYLPILQKYNIDYVPLLKKFKNAVYEDYALLAEENYHLMKEDCVGEGIVIKNYDFVNRYGRINWGKIVLKEFKSKHKPKKEERQKEKNLIEERIAEKYVTESLVEKTIAKIKIEEGCFESRHYFKLFGLVYYDVVNEEAWNFVKEFKNPTINFKTLNFFVINKIKEIINL